MAKYIVKKGQNIWDVAVYLYGSVEGLLDLLITNDWLDMTTELKYGMELEYHENYIVNKDIKTGIDENGYLPANAERHVYYKPINSPLAMIIAVANNEEFNISFDVAATNGTMIVDWGDNAPLQEIQLTPAIKHIEHWFDNKASKRRVRVYGEFSLTHFNASDVRGIIYPVRNITVDEFVCQKNIYPLDGLLLFDGTYSVDLNGATITNLIPVGNMNLQSLDLRNAIIDSSTIDDYLSYIVDKDGEKRPCTVLMTTEPSEVGMAKIQTIISEESWNQGGSWKFVINDVVYQYSE